MFTSGADPGDWRPTPPAFVSDPFAWVAKVRPFTLDSSSQFRTSGPQALTSEAYATEFDEVKALGSALSTTRTPAQTVLALFYTENPFTLWNRTFRTVAQDRGLTLVDSARLFAMLDLAAADAGIGCWDDKAYWSFWRPITAIQLADTDGNPATAADPAWTSLIPAPPYPEHPSGYNCNTGAMLHAARDFFGTNRIPFRVYSSTADVERSYSRVTQAVKDTINARIYLGIHFRTPEVQGAELGKGVAGWLGDHSFQAVD
ncbi:hypothetical protein BH18CHL1_BH18CHL1_03620 [soil metagenome]